MRDITIEVILGYILVILIKSFFVNGLYYECKFFCVVIECEVIHEE